MHDGVYYNPYHKLRPMKKGIKPALLLIFQLFLSGITLNAVPGNEIKLPVNNKIHIDKGNEKGRKIKRKAIHIELLKASAELLSRKEFREMLTPWVNDFNHWKSTKRDVE
jgi:hypothetical protein